MDTAQFSHNNITNSTITHADKVVHTIVNCTKAIKGVGHIGSQTEMRQLKKLMELMKQAV